MLEIGLALVVYSVALAFVHDRWGWRGSLPLNAALVLFLILGGLWLWPSQYGGRLSPSRMALCNATGTLPSVLLVMAGAYLALYLTPEPTTSLFAKWFWVALSGAILMLPATIAALWWGVQFLGCDTL